MFFEHSLMESFLKHHTAKLLQWSFSVYFVLRSPFHLHLNCILKRIYRPWEHMLILAKTHGSFYVLFKYSYTKHTTALYNLLNIKMDKVKEHCICYSSNYSTKITCMYVKSYASVAINFSIFSFIISYIWHVS